MLIADTRLVLLALMTAVSGAAAATTYHADALAGDDARDGLSPETAWKTLAPANKTVFGPGDRLLLKAGTAYDGPLVLQGAGSAQAPSIGACEAE